MNPFDFQNSVSHTGEYLMSDPYLTENQYQAFLVNRGLSYFPDTLCFAEAMNRRGHADRKLQYDYLYHAVHKRKRFSKWAKTEENGVIDAIKQVYGYNNLRAREALRMLKPDQIKIILDRCSTGGTTRKPKP